MIGGKEKPPLSVLLKNLPGSVESKGDRVPGACSLANGREYSKKSEFRSRPGYHVGRAQMILGLLHKAKKKRSLAFQHLIEQADRLAIRAHADALQRSTRHWRSSCNRRSPSRRRSATKMEVIGLEPSRLFEPGVQSRAEQRDDAEDDEIAIVRL